MGSLDRGCFFTERWHETHKGQPLMIVWLGMLMGDGQVRERNSKVQLEFVILDAGV